MPAHTGLCKHIPVTVVHGPIIMMLTSCATAELEAKPSLEADSEGFSKSDLFRALGGRSAPTMEIMYCVLWLMLMSQKAETAANTRVTNASQQLRRKKMTPSLVLYCSRHRHQTVRPFEFASCQYPSVAVRPNR